MGAGISIFILLPSAIFYHTEIGWTYLDSVYYAVISLSTIGFGDLINGHSDHAVEKRLGNLILPYRAFTILWLVFGLSFIFMVNTLILDSIRKMSNHTELKSVTSRLEGLMRGIVILSGRRGHRAREDRERMEEDIERNMEDRERNREDRERNKEDGGRNAEAEESLREDTEKEKHRKESVGERDTLRMARDRGELRKRIDREGARIEREEARIQREGSRIEREGERLKREGERLQMEEMGMKRARGKRHSLPSRV